ncbi:hypothetical protein NOR53_3543 [gamma proteobacterium NOR5-3]|nr:hypothetical protein NOR53_3543 [gamma proteobacterium NOR5-3]
MAAALPLVLGLALGVESQKLVSTDVVTDWELQERSLLLTATEGDWYE